MIIPLKDENPVKTYPIVTVLIILLNILIFVYELSLGNHLGWLIEKVGLIPFEITHWVDRPPHAPFPIHLTLISSMFLHGGVLHLIGNMLYLWVFGNNIEDVMGHLRFIVFYLLTGIIAGLAQVAVNPLSVVPMIGASGAVSGVLGAYLLLYPRARIVSLVFWGFFFTKIRIPAIFLLGFWIISQVVNSTASLMRIGGGGVAWFAHVGGFFAGLMLINLFKKRRNHWIDT